MVRQRPRWGGVLDGRRGQCGRGRVGTRKKVGGAIELTSPRTTEGVGRAWLLRSMRWGLWAGGQQKGVACGCFHRAFGCCSQQMPEAQASSDEWDGRWLCLGTQLDLVLHGRQSWEDVLVNRLCSPSLGRQGQCRKLGLEQPHTQSRFHWPNTSEEVHLWGRKSVPIFN